MFLPFFICICYYPNSIDMVASSLGKNCYYHRSCTVSANESFLSNMLLSYERKGTYGSVLFLSTTSRRAPKGRRIGIILLPYFWRFAQRLFQNDRFLMFSAFRTIEFNGNVPLSFNEKMILDFTLAWNSVRELEIL